MTLCLSLLLSTAYSFHHAAPSLRLHHHACPSAIAMSDTPPPRNSGVNITIRKTERNQNRISEELMEEIRAAAAEDTDETADDLMAKLRAAAAAAEVT